MQGTESDLDGDVDASQDSAFLQIKEECIFDDDYLGEEAYIEAVHSTLRTYLPAWAFKMVSVKVAKLTGSEEVCVIKVMRSPKPVFSKKIKVTENHDDTDNKKTLKKNTFFIRQADSSIALDEELSNQYIFEHFEH